MRFRITARSAKNFTALALAFASVSTSATLFAQDYPSKRVLMVVPNTAGGAIDSAARIVASKLSETLGQPVGVENRVGAGGVIGTNFVAQAAPDGYTLLAVFDSFATNPYLFKGVQYDPVKSFLPVSLMIRTPQVLVVHPSMIVKTLKSFIALAKKERQQLNHATAGAGTSSRLSFDLLKDVSGIESTGIHYKGGAPALNDVLGGHVPVMIIQMGGVVQHISQGKLLALGVSSAKRAPQLPDVPAIAETYPGFEVQSWVGILAPAGTPPAVVERLNGAVVKAMTIPDIREKFVAQGSEVVASTPKMFGSWIANETEKWERVIRKHKITLD